MLPTCNLVETLATFICFINKAESRRTTPTLQYHLNKNPEIHPHYSLTLSAHAQEGYCSCFVRVCLWSHISPLERLFVLKILWRTQRATKVKHSVGFSLKRLRSQDPALPPLKAIHIVGHFSMDSAHAYFVHAVAPRVLHWLQCIHWIMNALKCRMDIYGL